MIHSSSEVKSKKIGSGTVIWQYCVILENAEIGCDCNINAHVFIENEVKIGNRVTVKSGVQIWDGITIEDDVFIGPNVTFTNDKLPRSKQHPKEYLKTIVRKGCSIGANSTILPNVVLGEYCMIGAGSLLTKSIPDYALMAGSPAVQKGWVSKSGLPLIHKGSDEWEDENGNLWIVLDNIISPIE